MHTTLNRAGWVVAGVLALFVVAAMTGVVRGGPLDPPGTPAPTDGVRESGTPIAALPFTITQPGRYYVKRDLTGVAGQSGITIAQDGVTLDLNGFTLHGVANAVDGVVVSGVHSAVRIEHGTVRGWFNGIDAQTATYSTIANISAIQNGFASGDGSFGILIAGNSILEDCNVSNNTATGLLATAATVRNCVVTDKGNDGVRAAGFAMFQHNQVRHNDRVNTSSFVDFRVVGRGNSASDNALGQVDSTQSTGFNAFVRNNHCGFGFPSVNDYAPQQPVAHGDENIEEFCQ
jgi:hypothetical protein